VHFGNSFRRGEAQRAVNNGILDEDIQTVQIVLQAEKLYQRFFSRSESVLQIRTSSQTGHHECLFTEMSLINDVLVTFSVRGPSFTQIQNRKDQLEDRIRHMVDEADNAVSCQSKIQVVELPVK
jgi:hypothetical protein